MAVGLTHAESTTLDGAVAGDPEGRSRLFALLYADLRRMAAGLMRSESPGHTLQATALVNEAYGRMCDHAPPNSSDPAVILGCALRVMRQVLVDHARHKRAGIRGGGWARVSLDDTLDEIDKSIDMEGLHAALDRLEFRDPRLRLVLELRFFGGFTQEEVANLLKVSKSTVEKDERRAKAWLKAQELK